MSSNGKGGLQVTDERTGSQYELPITDGTIPGIVPWATGSS